jgi:hypothetical protein
MDESVVILYEKEVVSNSLVVARLALNSITLLPVQIDTSVVIVLGILQTLSRLSELTSIAYRDLSSAGL